MSTIITNADILTALAIFWGFLTLACAAALGMDYPRRKRLPFTPTRSHKRGNWR